MEGIPFEAHARVMPERPAVAVQVLIGLVIIVLLDPHDHTVAHERAYPTAVGVVGRTAPGEGGVIPILIVIDPLPGPIRIFAEGIAHLDDRLQRRQR
jgi:hypothetical protein